MTSAGRQDGTNCHSSSGIHLVWGGCVLANCPYPQGEKLISMRGGCFAAGRLALKVGWVRRAGISKVNALRQGRRDVSLNTGRRSPVCVSLYQAVQVASGHSLSGRRLESIMSKISADAGRCSKMNYTRGEQTQKSVCCQGRGGKASDSICTRRLHFMPLCGFAFTHHP